MKNSTIKRIFSYVGKYKVHLIAVVICAIFGNTLFILSPLLTGKAIDYIIGVNQVDFQGLIGILGILIVIYIIILKNTLVMEVILCKV